MGGPSSSSEGSSTPQIPAYLRPFVGQLAGQAGQASTMGGPLLAQSFGPNPLQIAGLTPQEQSLINSLVNQGTPGANPMMTGALSDVNAGMGDINAGVGDVNAAEKYLPLGQNKIGKAEDMIRQLTGGPIGSSPATTAAMNAFNTNVVPQEMQNLALSGAGRGGGAGETLTMGREAAYTPLVQQEIANREASIEQQRALAGQEESLAGAQAGLGAERAGFGSERAGLGMDLSSLAARKNALTQAGLQAAQMPQQNQQEQFNAQFRDLMRRFQLGQDVTVNPLYGLLGSLLGRKTSGSTSSDPGLMGDISGGLGIAQQFSNLFGS